MKNFAWRRVVPVVLLPLAIGECCGGVIANTNVAPGATSWPGTPLLSTVANPSTSTVVESFNGGGGNTNISQTFTISAANYTLQSISIYGGNGTGTGGGTNLVLRLFDLGTQTAPNPSPYTSSTGGGNLFGAGAGLSVSYFGQTPGILRFDFTGSDQVTLSNGHMYAFELTGVLNTTPVFWNRGTTDTYSGGAAYRNQAWINAINARDFALAVYANAPFNTNYPPVPFGNVYHIFTKPVGGFNPDGANPAAGLVLSGGLLCGTTVNGGLQGAGTAFLLAPDATGFNAFRAFANAPDGGYPRGDLIFSGARVFGATFGGGSSGVGTVFAGQTNGSVTVIRSFSALSADNSTNSDGASPMAVLAVAGGTLFGTTSTGGAAGNGTVFAMNTNGTGYTVLHDFTALDVVSGTNTDGATPAGGLVLAGNTLYGTTSAGGAGGNGTVFSMGTNGGGFRTLRHFSAMEATSGTNADGAMPMSGVLPTNNTLFGSTLAGGQGGNGVLFSIGTDGSGFSILHHFPATSGGSGTNADGAMPCAAPALAGDVLYGTAAAGGASGNGTVYSVRTNGAEFKTLYNFSALNATTGTNSDGALPTGGLVVLGNMLYGTAYSGGPGGVGTVFGLRVPSPAVITNVVLNPDRSVTLTFAGGPNSTNVVQRADGLSAPVSWQNIATNVADGHGLWQFTETNTTASPRFYRSYAP